MKVVFVSNYYNHHQAPFSEAMAAATAGSYRFIETEPMSEERRNMGWGVKQYPDFVLRAGEYNKEQTEALINEAEIVLHGGVPYQMVSKRIHQGKLTFQYSERIYKTGYPALRIAAHTIKHYIRYGRFSNSYLLCASAYAAADYSRTGVYKGKAYKWGYFPGLKEYDVDELIKKKLSVTSVGWKYPRVSILWAGRLIGWKHPEASIEVAERLKNEGYSFIMNMIGSGEMEQALREMIEEKGLGDCVEMLGTMCPDEVRTHMEQADIYLFTSDFNEGWGAVLNESMNSGCAVVASHAIGSVPFLIQNNANGMIYKSGDMDSLYQAVKRLLDDRVCRVEMGRKAYETMKNIWNAEKAAQRLLRLSEELNKKSECDLFVEGPCSKAEIMKDDWLNDKYHD